MRYIAYSQAVNISTCTCIFHAHFFGLDCLKHVVDQITNIYVVKKLDLTLYWVLYHLAAGL